MLSKKKMKIVRKNHAKQLFEHFIWCFFCEKNADLKLLLAIDYNTESNTVQCITFR